MQKIIEKNSLSSPKPTFFVFFIHIIRNSLHHFPPQNLSHPSSYFILLKFLFISSLYRNLFSKLVENHLKIDRKRIIQKESHLPHQNQPSSPSSLHTIISLPSSLSSRSSSHPRSYFILSIFLFINLPPPLSPSSGTLKKQPSSVLTFSTSLYLNSYFITNVKRIVSSPHAFSTFVSPQKTIPASSFYQKSPPSHHHVI